ncbi:hypothetical protein PBT90_04085 [Algoriphagus halophytocola]|uniref:Uncharacterized protein n=1 Tax=Algoriphagus halophytocola TaxID=2991499 RepID=A0ABY6MFJ9_9BACT|nr:MULTISPECIES: hypothetical protein [unclassified Algoriphagus]UZD22598.1 hypothetical protein OM944_18345 [Algoriphagus sp. TR-M5]WBL43864.1 hypothetical protein PBT90_04085 [Algoriphagus sp. TR-M9]
MDIRNDASSQYLFAQLVRRPKTSAVVVQTEVASILKFIISYITLASLLVKAASLAIELGVDLRSLSVF